MGDDDQDEEKSARETMERSRTEVMECEEEIRSIKGALKSLTTAEAASSPSSPSSLNNSLEVSVLGVKAAGGAEGDDDAAPPMPTTFRVHLSSPIEERTISRIRDPLDPEAEGSVARFESVETSNALLTVEAFSDAEGSAKLGASAPHDLLPLCQDAELWKRGGEKKVSTLDVAIVAEEGTDETFEETAAADEEVKSAESESWEDAVDEEDKEEGGEAETKPEAEEEADVVEKEDATKDGSGESKPEAAQDEAEASKLELPLYTVTIQLEYVPSADDRRDALYQQLNEVGKRKVAAIDSLRKSAGVISRANKAAEASTGGEVIARPGKSPAVKSGFLNKGKAEKTPPFWKRWYDKTIGPKSMLWVVGPVAKNYVVFVGLSLFVHYKGDLLALPPPV